jgi:hypothetical protein
MPFDPLAVAAVTAHLDPATLSGPGTDVSAMVNKLLGEAIRDPDRAASIIYTLIVMVAQAISDVVGPQATYMGLLDAEHHQLIEEYVSQLGLLVTMRAEGL